MMREEFWFGAMALVNFIWVVPLILVGVAVPYVTARMRERNGPPDPHIGIKTAHYFFFSAGIFMMLSGATLICIELMEIDGRPRGGGGFGGGGFGGPRGAFPGVRPPFLEAPEVRTGLAMIITGAVFAILHRLLALATNDARMPQIRRAFTGLRFIVSGLVVFFGMALLLGTLFQPRSEFGAIKPMLGVMIVWAPSWFIHMAFLLMTTPRAVPDSGHPTIGPYDDDD